MEHHTVALNLRSVLPQRITSKNQSLYISPGPRSYDSILFEGEPSRKLDISYNTKFIYVWTYEGIKDPLTDTV